MVRFVSCDVGWVNLDHVVKAREQRRSDGIVSILFEGAEGKPIGRTFISRGDLEELTAPVVPAASGATAVLITPYSSTDRVGDRPDRVHVEHVPIVAWRIVFGV